MQNISLCTTLPHYSEEKKELATKEAREIAYFDIKTSELDMSKEPVTKCDNNSKVHLPRKLSQEEEVNIAIRRKKFRKAMKRYIKEFQPDGKCEGVNMHELKTI